MSAPAHPPNRRSVVVVVGVLLAVVVGLGVAGMIGSMVIAQINRGMATAVNQSGTLRMQSYRIGVALADESVPPLERRARVERLATEFEQRLKSHRLTDALPRSANDPVRLAYERVRWRWAHEMRRALVEELARLTGESKTRAVVVALRERLERARRERDRQSLSNDLQAIGKRCAAYGCTETRDHGEFLYDEAGLPR